MSFNVLYALSTMLGEGVSLIIVTGASVLSFVSTFLDPVAIATVIIC